MSRVELESFLKSFALFFTSLGLLLASLSYLNYTKNIQTLDETLFSQMRICSFDLKCEQFQLDFVTKEDQKPYTLYKDENGLYSYYPVPRSEKFFMRLDFSAKQYSKELKSLQNDSLWKFASVLAIIFLLSIAFSFYALHPLRNALLLTQEFIKDILHDFNTPLASLRLNTSMLKQELGDNQKIERIEQSVENVLSLQSHLRSYLDNHALQKEEFELDGLIQTQINMLEKNYPDISFDIDVNGVRLYTSRKAFTRIMNNLLTNAAKYNKQNGTVKIQYKNNTLKIIDSGKGIKNPKRIFERFYKEQERGIGIGLHIVKKLCDELGILITIESTLDKGSKFTLDISRLTLG